jgi:hypothetical protein
MNTELQKSAELMLSADYKERFVAEYMQIDNRLRGLKKMLNSWDEGTLTFTPACPRETARLSRHPGRTRKDRRN